MIETIILSGNCYWCLEAVFQKIKGVKEVHSGYYSLNDYAFKFIPDDKLEVVKLVYETDIISLNDILNIFYSCHTPTLNSWVKEDCFSYLTRSSIICFDEQQVKIAEEKITDINHNKMFESDAQTKIIKYLKDSFKLVAPKESNYYINNPNEGYCQSIIIPKLEKVKILFPTFIVD